MDWSIAWQVLGAIGLTGAFSAWLGGYLGGFLPPPARILRAVRNAVAHWRGNSVSADDSRYRLVLCGLDGDDAREGTLGLLRKALNPADYPMLRVILSARCIRLNKWYTGKDPAHGTAKAEKVLMTHKADAVLWGEVVKLGDSIRVFVSGAGRQAPPQIIVFDKGPLRERPDEAIGAVLAAVALSQTALVSDESGRYLAARLRPITMRLTTLLADPRLVPASERANLSHALGLAHSTVGDQTGDSAELDSAIAAYHDALKEWTRERAPFQWAATQNDLGATLAQLGEHQSDPTRLEEAVKAFRGALEERTREREPLQWAATQSNLGRTLTSLGERERDPVRLEEAVKVLRDALEEGTRERFRLGWASTQTSLGSAIASLGELKRSTELLEEAVTAYRAALEELPRELVPLNWAATQNNLGTVLWKLGELEGDAARLNEAVKIFRDALGEWTRERVPLEWAMAQNNLGIVLSRIGEREGGTGRLNEAVRAFRATLTEWTRERAPLQWAATQSNLGLALMLLGERQSDSKSALKVPPDLVVSEAQFRIIQLQNPDLPLTWFGDRKSSTELFEEAVNVLRDALQELPREHVPVQWANAQTNLGLALTRLGERESGTVQLEEAIEVFRVVLQDETHERGSLERHLSATQAILNERLMLRNSCRPCENPLRPDSGAA